jgi:hypothetical protein
MIDKFAILMVVVAAFIVSAWITAAPAAGRHAQSDGLKKRLDAHRRFVSAQIFDDMARAGYEPTGQDAIRRLYDQCGSY